MLLLLLAFAAVSQSIICANGQSVKDINTSSGITQQYRQNIIEIIKRRLVNAVNALAAVHRLLNQEQHVQINLLQEAQLRVKLHSMKQVLSSQAKASVMPRLVKRKLQSGKFCY
jgi:hypothetical protein